MTRLEPMAASYPLRQPDKGVDNVRISGNSFHNSSTSCSAEVLTRAAARLHRTVKL
jgi:hypothetical protein